MEKPTSSIYVYSRMLTKKCISLRNRKFKSSYRTGHFKILSSVYPYKEKKNQPLLSWDPAMDSDNSTLHNAESSPQQQTNKLSLAQICTWQLFRVDSPWKTSSDFFSSRLPPIYLAAC